MGFRFRKSVKLGPVRVTLSKTGVSTSVGVKGFRVTKRADGKVQTTASIPGTGISYVEQHGGSKNEPAQRTVTDAITGPAAEEVETLPKYEHIHFFLLGTTDINEDGEKRQDILYRFKLRKPPFDKGKATLSISDDDEKSPETRMTITINGAPVGEIPVEDMTYIDQNWERIDAVTALEVTGRRGDYAAEVYVRLFCNA